MKRVAAVLEVSFFALGSVAVAGADKKSVWAGAAIEGGSVVVSSAQVAKPEWVRYAWSGNALRENLFNKDGLPAQAFRNDGWT